MFFNGSRAIIEQQEQLLVPEQKSPQKLNLERDTAEESAMNAALAQAAQTNRASKELANARRWGRRLRTPSWT